MFEFHWATLVLMGLGCFVVGGICAMGPTRGGCDD